MLRRPGLFYDFRLGNDHILIWYVLKVGMIPRFDFTDFIHTFVPSTT